MDQDFCTRFHKILDEWYPRVAASGRRLSPLLLSCYQVPIAAKTLIWVQKTIAIFEKLAHLSLYRDSLPPPDPRLVTWTPGNRGALTSFDFHITPEGLPKLIEVNTNAAFGLLGEVLYAAHSLPLGIERKMSQQLRATFVREVQSFVHPRAIKNVAIVDEDPPRQNFYLEFLMYQDLFADLGWSAQIDDVAAFTYRGEQNQLVHKASRTIIDLVYNRYTDFYLQETPSRELREAYYHGAAVFTPHPREYWLLADKNRLAQLSQEHLLAELPIDAGDKEVLRQVIPKTLDKRSFVSAEDLWKRRKAYFLKPATSHGAKAVYKGASISRKVLEQIWDSDFLAQEVVPPTPFHPAPDSVPFKFDLRCIAYAGEIQMLLARLYRGQLTNFKTPGGGLAAVIVNDEAQ